MSKSPSMSSLLGAARRGGDDSYSYGDGGLAAAHHVGGDGSRDNDNENHHLVRHNDEATYSKRVTEMVLAGWTLLDEFCPVFGAVPLVKDTRGRKYSVAQEAYVRDAGLPPPPPPLSGGAAAGGANGGAVFSSPVPTATPHSRYNNAHNEEERPLYREAQRWQLQDASPSSSLSDGAPYGSRRGGGGSGDSGGGRDGPWRVDSYPYDGDGYDGYDDDDDDQPPEDEDDDEEGTDYQRGAGDVAEDADGDEGQMPLLLPPGVPTGTVLDQGAVLRATRQTLLDKILCAERGLREEQEEEEDVVAADGTRRRRRRLSNAAVMRMERLAALLRDCTQVRRPARACVPRCEFD